MNGPEHRPGRGASRPRYEARGRSASGRPEHGTGAGAPGEQSWNTTQEAGR